MNRADRALFRFAAIGGKTGKVMSAEEAFCCRVQGFKIERSCNMPGATALKRGQDGRSPDSVAINFSFGREASVKIVRDISTAKDANSRREQRVESIDAARWCQEFVGH